VICTIIINKDPEELEADYGLKITDENRDYVMWNPIMLPVFCAAINGLFEGN
jgi:hypothetical protein